MLLTRYAPVLFYAITISKCVVLAQFIPTQSIRDDRISKTTLQVEPQVKNQWAKLVPLSEMSATDRYHGEDGGLYGQGQNTPPKDHLNAAITASGQIGPLDRTGRPSPQGKIGVVSIGMSNTAIHWRAVMKRAEESSDIAENIVFIQGARGGMDAHDWAVPDQRLRSDRPDPWVALDRALRRADVSAAQVQAAWMMHARRSVARLGAFPKHAETLTDDMAAIVRRAKVKFPNLRIIYLSNRIYAGYATTTQNPEPYAYENSFSVRWLIQKQIAGDPDLNWSEQQGAIRAPVLLWGPDLWANGDRPRRSDGLAWLPDDFKAKDHMHPADQGAYRKSAPLILGFFKRDPTTREWFLDIHVKR